MKTCATCRFFQNLTIDTGLCRRFPPTAAVSIEQTSSAYPPVKLDAWCGEYQEPRRTLWGHLLSQ